MTEREQGRRRRANNENRIPQRVENAAQNMQASSGPRRGYIPQDTGQMNAVTGGWQQTGQQAPVQGGYYAAQQPQQPYFNGQASYTGSQRGYVMTQAPNTKPQKPKKKHTGFITKTGKVLSARLIQWN